MKLRVFEAFAGYGSQSIALDLLSQSFPDFQFETVGISEIDKYAIRAYHTLHGEAIPNHGDITKIISNSQLYKLAGNSIVVACLYHIFRKMFCETAREYGAPTAHSQEIPDVQQLSLF
ncbi:DNA cytosine methyltransferase [Duncaniella muris]|uniref:DNA cytosine methyltransferase n=1 Tax=Duncaniella muris TaxID=2094150 RepID=UPI000AA46238|nr:DNA cytosine methyltransferase [Duncaniella muris]